MTVRVPSVSPGIPTFIMIVLLAVPPALTYLLPVTSFAPGISIACLLALAACRFTIRRKRSGGFGLPLLVLAIAVHFAVAATRFPIDFGRFSGSLLILALMIVTAQATNEYLFNERTDRAASIIFKLMLTLAVLGIVGLQPPGIDAFVKPVFPFTEPSHFALEFLPFLMWRCVSASGKAKHGYLLAGLAIGLALQNLTLVAGVALVAIVYTSYSKIGALLALMLLVGVAVGPDLSYYSNRLDFSDENQNLSSLVFLQGWQMLQESLTNSHGWGLGFQQLGVNGTSVDAAAVILALKGEFSNVLDGGFLLAKFGSELGAFALAAVAVLCWFAVRSAIILRRVATGRQNLPAGTVLAHSIMVTYLIEIFVRSNGYLIGTFALVLAAGIHLHRVRAYARKQRRRAPPGRRLGLAGPDSLQDGQARLAP